MTLSDIRRQHASRNDFVNQFFNTAAFVPVAQLPRGIYGNAGRNTLAGPALNQTDLNVMKDIILREPWKLQFRGEFFNAFNHAQFGPPTSTVASPVFGLISSARAPRLVQLGMRLIY